jgi:hypothetical protein
VVGEKGAPFGVAERRHRGPLQCGQVLAFGETWSPQCGQVMLWLFGLGFALISISPPSVRNIGRNWEIPKWRYY